MVDQRILLKIIITTLVMISCLLVSACLDQATASEESTPENATGEVVDLQQENGEQPMLNDHKKVKDSSDNNRASAGETETSPALPSPSGSLPLLVSLTEISREAYATLYGKTDLLGHPITAVATLIGRAEINAEALSPDTFKKGIQLNLTTFDGSKYNIILDSITSGEVTTLVGTASGSAYGNFYATLSDDVMLATLELPALNGVYLIKYHPGLPGYYLYKAPLQAVEVLEDAPPLIPPSVDDE